MYSSIYISAFIVCCSGFIVFIYCPNLDEIFTVQFIEVYNQNNLKQSEIIQSISEVQASSVWCLERLDGSKMCKFNNLFFLPNYKEFFFFYLSESSILSGVKSPGDLNGISLSTIQNHPGLGLKLVFIKSLQEIWTKSVLIMNDVFIMKRFKPDNIMHVIHDDLLPLYLTYQELCGGNVTKCILKYQLMFSDDNSEGPYYEWYSMFSKKSPIMVAKHSSAVCIKNGMIGLSQESVWFQYGFKSVHGPVLNPKFNGLRIKEFSKFIKSSLGIKENIDSVTQDENNPLSIVFLSRKINRKILNESQVVTYIKTSYESIYKTDVNVYNVDLSLNNSKDIIQLLQTSKALIGMHGSGMILSLFLPESSLILELFPFGIEPKFVSFVKAMCSIQGVLYHYVEWKNTNESNTLPHPEYLPLHGGILNLPLATQQEIINTKIVPPVSCCHNPLYLFRMFQDTLLDHNFYTFFEDIIRFHSPSSFEISKRNTIESIVDSWFLPSPVFHLSCKCTDNTMIISWKYPFAHKTRVKFSLATSTGIIEETRILQFFKKVQDCNLEISKTSVWVKAVYNDNEGLDAYTLCL